MLSWYIPPMNENDKDEDGGYFSNSDGLQWCDIFYLFPW